MPLDEYQQKRHFEKTPEPSGTRKPGKRTKSPRRSFVIQKHDASRLHYDFRLELDGVMVSWAIPKGPSLDTRDKRLAVHVEDHPVDYASFEGMIPAGEYGAGTVVVWDRGWWEPLPMDSRKKDAPIPDPADSLAKGELKFRLHGEKLEGGWVLIRLKPREGERGESWLLIKEKDEFVRPSAEFDVLKERPESVKSGRTLEQVTAEESGPSGSTYHSNRPAARRSARSRSTRSASVVPQAEAPSLEPGHDTLPDDTPLQLATLVQEAPEGEGWIHEVKYDGYRIKAVLEQGRARLITRNNLDWTPTFANVARAVEQLPARSAVLDGEVVAFDSAGVTDFGTLQDAIATKRVERLVYVVFDLLYLEGHDLRKAPLLQRKELLRALVEAQPKNDVIRYADHFAEQGTEFHSEACAHGLEGSVSKRADRPWVAGRTRDWLKVKCSKEQEFVVGGFTDPGGSRKGFGALLLGVYASKNELRYTGRVGTGFNERMLAELRKRLDKLETKEPAFANPPRLSGRVHWVRPELIAEVKFAEWTRDGSIRHPSFQGLREDKPPTDVTFEVAETTEGSAATLDGGRRQHTGQHAGHRASSRESQGPVRQGRDGGGRQDHEP